MENSDKFYIVGMMFVVGVWFVHSFLASMMMMGLGFFFIAIWVIMSGKELKLQMLIRKHERIKYFMMMEQLDRIEKLLKNKKKTCQKKR